MAAITPQFPLPLPPWARWGLRALPLVWAVAEALLDHPGQVQTNGDLIWRRAAVHWSRGEGSQTPEDDCICTFDIANITNSDIDGSWTAGDYSNCDSQFATFLNRIAQHQATDYRVAGVNYYRMQFASPMTPSRRFVPSGPPEHIGSMAVVGTALGDALPPQVAFSVTEKTSIPRHWGRFYLPGFAESTSGGPTGRWSAAVVDDVVTATRDFYVGLQGLEFFPVVVSTQVDKILAGSLIGVTNVGADDVPDVIRRRRHELVAHSTFLP